MIVLTGNNLGERQRELNAKVKEAAEQQVNFDQIKDETEKSDVDKFFKIDLASKYLNIEYIIDVLKSGDSLHISRALKCDWMYGDKFSNIINVDYIHNNVIPFMSNKMKKKFLTAISINVRNEARAAEFYQYCMDHKYKDIALKFLNFTSDIFKLELLKDKSKCNHLISNSVMESLNSFIGLSFTLATAYVDLFHETNRMVVLKKINYLYSVSDVKYLDLLEKSVVIRPYNNVSLALRISRSVMKHHKDRVLKNPSVYVQIINKSALVKYSTAEDAKFFAAAVLPETVDGFWNQNYCSKYKYILDKIQVGKFEYVKQIFMAKYPGQLFEMHLTFYLKEYYKIMTAEEKETWALQQIASETEILGIDKDYCWYKFVNFEKAFEEIKKLILITSDKTKRADMLLVLAEAVQTQRDVEKLMKYFYERHGNEQRFIKEKMIDKILQRFNVYEFDKDCWAAFNNMFHNLQVYNVTEYTGNGEYRIIALIYHVINKTDVPEAIRVHINSEMQFYALKLNTDKLTKEQQEMVFHYLFEFYTNEVKKLEQETYHDGIKYRLRKYIHFIMNLLDQYGRTKSDLPDCVNKFIKLDWEEFKCHCLIREPAENSITQSDLLRDLKKDAKVLIEHLPLIKTNIDDSFKFNISTVLNKLKIYFSHDIATDYLKFFEELLTRDLLWLKVAQAAAHGIFQLGDESFKTDFLMKYAPTEAAINHSDIDEKLLRIQQSICAHACYSRPPVPLEHMVKYIKGDYVHFCLPMFQSYLANLPPPLCLEFIEEILNKPVSIQKHGIRLAFQCFNAENLNKLVLRAWKKTKNVSLRMVIFKALFKKVIELSTTEDILFDTFKTISLTLGQDDEDEIFSLLISRQVRDHMMPDCLEISWNVVSKFPLKSANLKRMRSVIVTMCSKIDIIRQETVRRIIDEFIESMFDEESQEEGDPNKPNTEGTALIEALWKLTATFIINVRGENDLDKKVELTKHILNKYLKQEDTNATKKKVLLKKCFRFVNDLEKRSYFQDYHNFTNVNTLMQFVLTTLQDELTIEETYMVVWELRLGMVARKVIADGQVELEHQKKPDKSLMKNIAINFGNELGYLFLEFIEKGLFFASFSAEIETKIDNKTQTVKNTLDSRNLLVDIITLVCLGLVSHEIPEIYLTVLNLLPNDSDLIHQDEYKSVINKISKLDNKEIRCNLYKKFSDSEFVYDTI